MGPASRFALRAGETFDPNSVLVERFPVMSNRRLHSPLEWFRWIGRNAKRIAVFIVGVVVVAAGVAMLVLPGPGLVVIILGLGILATEFAWAERALDSAKAKAKAAAASAKSVFSR